MEKCQLKCKLHPTESVTNFCLQNGCFTELCAACICDHTEAHNRLNTKPKYQLIKNACIFAHDSITGMRDVLNKQKNRVTLILDKISKQKSQTYKILKQTRQQVLSLVNRTFDQLEIHYKNHLQQQKQKTGLLNQPRLNQIFSQINQYQVDLYQYSQQMITLKKSKLIRSIHSEILPAVKNKIADISKQLSSNQCFQPNLMFVPSNLQSVSAAIKKLFITSVSYPIDVTTTTNLNQYFNRTGRSLSKNRQVFTNTMRVLNIQTPNLVPSRDNSLRKSSTFIRPGLQVKSPKFTQTGFSITAKQNYFASSGQEYQYKPFSNTFS